MANIKHLLDKIRTAIYGKEVRGSLADGLQAVNNESEDAKEISVNVEQRQDAVEEQFDDVLSELSDDREVDNAETIAARTNRETGANYKTLGNRLDDENKQVTQQLAETRKYVSTSFSTLQTQHKGKKPLITIILDDATDADKDKILPIAQEFNAEFATAVITDRVGTSGYLEWEEIKQLEDTGLFEIIFHGHKHENLREMSEQEIVDEMETGIKLMRENGFNPQSFVYPLNAHDDDTVKVVRRYFNYAFSKPTGQGVGKNYPTIDNQVIRRIALGSYFDGKVDGFPSDTSSLEYYKARVDEAIDNDNWLVFVMHPASTDDKQFEYLKETIQYARSKNVDIVTPSKGFAMFGNIIEIDGISGKIVVDADGNFNSDSDAIYIDPQKDMRMTDQSITSYPKDKITVSGISNNHAAKHDFPEHKGGSLTTYRTRTEWYLNYQEYIPTTGTKRKYRRFVDSNHNWQEWLPYDTYVLTERNKFSVDQPYSDYEIGQTTVTEYTSRGAHDNGMPHNTAGLLTTDRFSTEFWSVKQTYETYQGAGPYRKSIRYVDPDTREWTDWILLKSRTVGSTKNRPKNVENGYFYYDTDIEKPLWYVNGTWRDAEGSSL